MMISPTEAVPTVNDHYCGNPGSTQEHGGAGFVSFYSGPRVYCVRNIALTSINWTLVIDRTVR